MEGDCEKPMLVDIGIIENDLKYDVITDTVPEDRE